MAEKPPMAWPVALLVGNRFSQISSQPAARGHGSSEESSEEAVKASSGTISFLD